jgi:hypothetical protein
LKVTDLFKFEDEKTPPKFDKAIDDKLNRLAQKWRPE